MVASDVRDAEQRIRPGVIYGHLRPGGAAVLGTHERATMTDGDAHFGVLERHSRQGTGDRGRNSLPCLAAVVGNEREAALTDCGDSLVDLRDVEQQDPVAADVDDDALRWRRLGGLRLFLAARRRHKAQARAQQGVSNSRPVFHATFPRGGIPLPQTRPAPAAPEPAIVSLYEALAPAGLPAYLVPRRRSASGWKSAHLPFWFQSHGALISLSRPEA